MSNLQILLFSLLSPVLVLALPNSSDTPIFPRYSYHVPCLELREAVVKNGALYIYDKTGSFDLYVSHTNHCPQGQKLWPKSIQAKDGPCPLYKCESMP